jgi:hypothetical protein
MIAAESIGRTSEGNLSKRLGQAIDAEREADHAGVISARHGFRVDCEHRQYKEQAKHSQRENRGERGARADFGA